MFNVTAEATDGAKNKGVDNYGSSPTMNGVAALASGGNVNYGIENGGDSEPATPTMTNVTATAIDGATSNHGVYNSVLGAPEIRSSAISGATASITNDGGSASISDTLLEGGGRLHVRRRVHRGVRGARHIL